MKTILTNITTAGVKGAFHEAIQAFPSVWDKHCQFITANTETVPLAFTGFLPEPRQFLDGRQFRGIRDFRYNVTNQEFELSAFIERKTWEDDQTGTLKQRIGEMAECWAAFKDEQFAQLIANGDVSGNNGFDGVTFFSDSRTIGDSATIDNLLGALVAAAGDNVPTAAELMTGLDTALRNMWKFEDDQGRPYNGGVMSRGLRLIVPPSMHRPAVEAMNSTIISNSSNPWGMNMAEVDVLPNLASITECVISATAGTRKGWIYMERTPLEVEVLNDGPNMAINNGVMILARQRYILTYGDPRRACLLQFT